MLSKRSIDHIQAALGVKTISAITPVGGGSINEAYLFKAGTEDFFLKVNSAEKFPGMFATEAKGLKLLAANCKLAIPSVILESQQGDQQFLVMEYFNRKSEDTTFYHSLGKGLAALHKNTQTNFGLDHNNYIGSLPQDNTQEKTWADFFINRRIEPLLRIAIDEGELPKNCRTSFENFFKKLGELFPNEKPALLHGDLWSGNKMNSTAGASIFDPAVYYGQREMDIAMTKLFGGFEEEFYSAYINEFSLEKGWQQRVDWFNLYPLLVHTVLFGGSYANDVIDIAGRF